MYADRQLMGRVDAPFTQELAVTDLGAAQNGNISVAHSATFEQREMHEMPNSA